MMNRYITKSINANLDDIQTKANGETTITGYFASFDTLDSDGDVFQKGAFKKSIQENKNRIMHLLQHDSWRPIGRPEVTEDSKGLRFSTTIGKHQMKVGYISDTVSLYKAGVYNEHSVGFIPINEKEEEDHTLITEVKLFEGSTVTWGANENTPMTGIKGISRSKRLETAMERLGKVAKALRTGGLTDNAYICLEIELEQIKSLFNEEPSRVDTLYDDEPVDLIKSFTSNLKKSKL